MQSDHGVETKSEVVVLSDVTTEISGDKKSSSCDEDGGNY